MWASLTIRKRKNHCHLENGFRLPIRKGESVLSITTNLIDSVDESATIVYCKRLKSKDTILINISIKLLSRLTIHYWETKLIINLNLLWQHWRSFTMIIMNGLLRERDWYVIDAWCFNTLKYNFSSRRCGMLPFSRSSRTRIIRRGIKFKSFCHRNEAMNTFWFHSLCPDYDVHQHIGMAQGVNIVDSSSDYVVFVLISNTWRFQESRCH